MSKVAPTTLEPARLIRSGVVYTETVVHLAPDRFADEVPYQVIIVSLNGDSRITARVLGERVAIGDPVVEAGTRDGIGFFSKIVPINDSVQQL